MPRHFRREVDTLKKKVLHLTAVVEENLAAAVAAVTAHDAELAEHVIAKDQEIDQLEVELEEECLKILALHQPVAIDLRFIIATLKINNDLERIGDLAVNIAERISMLAPVSLREIHFDLPKLLELTMAMVKDSADALVEMDTELARRVCRNDDQVDELERGVRRATEEQIHRKPEMAGHYIGLLGISRDLERIADHATNIAEDVVYMVDGEIVRHRGKQYFPGVEEN